MLPGGFYLPSSAFSLSLRAASLLVPSPSTSPFFCEREARGGGPARPPAARLCAASPASHMDEDLREMRKADLTKYAASMGAQTRREGAKLYRPVEEVRADCVTARRTAGPPDDFQHMNRAELLQAAGSLRLTTGRGARTAAELRGSRRRAAAGQLTLEAVMTRGSASRGSGHGTRARAAPVGAASAAWSRKCTSAMTFLSTLKMQLKVRI